VSLASGLTSGYGRLLTVGTGSFRWVVVGSDLRLRAAWHPAELAQLDHSSERVAP
jgi:hypothetical protein